MTDIRVDNPELCYKLGQSLIARVKEVDEGKKRFILSLRTEDVHDNSTTPSVDILEDYLQELDLIAGAYSNKRKADGKMMFFFFICLLVIGEKS